MLHAIAQAVAQVPSSTVVDGSHATEIATGLGTFIVVLVTGISNHFKGRNRDRSSNSKLDKIDKKLDAFAVQVDELDHIVRGVDGENGLRSRVRILEAATGTMRPEDVGSLTQPRHIRQR